MLQPGQDIGPYTVIAQLGRGGMGEVYRARDPRLERDVAIKVLPEAFTADAGRVVRFEQEAKAIAALSHPNDRTRGMSRLPWNRCRARATHRAPNAQPRLWDRA